MKYQDIEKLADKHIRNLTATHEEATEIVSFDTVVFHKYDFLLELKTKMKEAMMEAIGEREEINEQGNLSSEGKRKFYRNELRAEQRQRVNEFFEEEEIAQ
jgi:hypothetical protein